MIDVDVMMSSEPMIQGIYDQLFAEPTVNVFAVLDGASIKGLPKLLWEHKPEHVCLYRGELSPDLAACAPYLVRLQPRSPFTDIVIREGWGKHWGVFALSSADLKTLRKHFRNLLIVRDPQGKSLYFRYYDPRVLRVYLPTCNAQETRMVFGPVESYVLEDEKPSNPLCFMVIDGTPRREPSRIAARN